jgi:two-component system cell cycle response regulator CpdR
MAKILLAEDDESMRTFLARSLERVGHQVQSVSDGFEALPHVANETFDILVTDIVMPGMDGLELARRASVEIPELRVIFITGFAAVALNNRTAHQADTKILSKPFHLNTLVDEIERVLATA